MDPDPLDFDAVILAGGRSSRLGGVPKQGLTYDGDTLLGRSAAAARGARAAVVVGPGTAELPEGLLSCREEPVFGGPAAAIGAGLARLGAIGGKRPPFTLVLACDMPHVELAVAELKNVMDAAGARQPDGFVAVSQDGRRQPLAAFYSTTALQKSVDVLTAGGGLTNASVTALLASLDVQLVAVPAGSTADVDTWDDAAALGVAGVEPFGGSQRDADAHDLGGKA